MEIIFPFIKGNENKITNILRESIIETNKELNLNVELGISIDFGSNYAAIH